MKRTAAVLTVIYLSLIGCTAAENLDTVVDSIGLSGKACYMDGKRIETIFDAKGKEWPLSGQVISTLGIKHEVCTFSAKAEPTPPSYRGMFAQGTVYDSHGRALKAYKLDQFTWHLNDADWTKAPQGWTESPTSAVHLLPAKTPRPTRQDDQAPRQSAPSLGAPTREQHPPTPKPTPTNTPTQTPVPPEDRFLEIRYDASKTVNNRQPPANDPNCGGGSGPLTRWSRTIDIRNKNALIRDAMGTLVQVVQMDFAYVHPGRRASQTKCPNNEYRANVTVESLNPNAEVDLTGFVAEFRNAKGNLIASTLAHDGIRITLDHDSQPEDLYDKPAIFLLYDQYTKGAQPTPTPQMVILPEHRQVIFTVNLDEWELKGVGTGKWAMESWTAATRQSPDMLARKHQIMDANDQLWTVKSMYTVEKTGKLSGARDTAEYQIHLTNDNRAQAQFTGYRVAFTTLDDDVRGEGDWDPIENQQPVGSAEFTGITQGVPKGQIQVRIWDTFEPGIKAPDSTETRTGTSPPTATPQTTPTPRPTSTPTPAATPTPIATLQPTSTPTKAATPIPATSPQPTPTPTPGPDHYMAEGIKLHEEGKHHEALNQFQQARILSGMDTSELKLWQGRAHRGLGDLDTALRELNIAVYLDDNAINLSERGGVHADLSNEGEALEDGYAARNSPDQTDGWRHSKAEANLVIARGWALINRWDDSLSHAKEALEVATGHGYPEDKIGAIRTVLEEAERQLGR